MWQSIVVAAILAICLFFIGRKLYQQFKIATDPKEKMSCGCGCSGCSSQTCTPASQQKKDQSRP
jgi:Fe-S cluster assembly iron-binding protein IscA